jgi:nicotinamidase-related amidase
MNALLAREEAVVLLIDHQVGVMDWVVQSPPADLVKANVVKLARAAEILGAPLLLSTNQEQVNGPLIPELVEAAGAAAEDRVERAGTVDALADPQVAARLEETGRRSLILAGIGSDVCAVFPALHALGEGYRVYVVADACGTTSEFSHEVALRRMEAAGARLVTTASILAELAVNFATSPGRDILAVMQGRPFIAG